MGMRIAVFLDRDGTLNIESGYIREVENLHLIPGAAQAVRQLNDAGILAILTTNQSGPARGYYDEAHVNALNQRLVDLLREEANACLDAVFYCPHLPDGTVARYSGECQCRKPNTGMIEAALRQFPDIDLPNSYVVGDKATDVDLAYNARCKGILLETGYGKQVLDGSYQALENNPHFICDNIGEAVQRILQDSTVKTA